MTDQDTIKTEIAKALSRAHPPVIMSLEDVAIFTGHAYSYVRNELQNTPGFPQRLDRFKQPRWARDDVMRWHKKLSTPKRKPELSASTKPKLEVSESEMVKTYLYRHLSSSGELLYVGMSLSAVHRLSQHRGANWFDQIASVTIEPFPSRHTASIAEVNAIKTERPKFNIIHRSRNE